MGNLQGLRVCIFCFVCVLFSCGNRNSEDIDLELLKKGVLEGGDTSAYENLSSYYFKDNIKSLLPYSLIMADSFGYARANYDVFEIIYITNSEDCIDYDLSCLTEKDKNMALSYLVSAIKNGDLSASKVYLNFYKEDTTYKVQKLYENSELIKIAESNISSCR